MRECDPDDFWSDDYNDYTESCAFCEAVVTLFKILTGLLNRMQPHMPPVKFNQYLFKLRRSEYDVNFFKGYQMRKMVSRKAWDILKEQCPNYVTFMTFDFPMRYFLKQNRGTTIGWYGRVS